MQRNRISVVGAVTRLRTGRSEFRILPESRYLLCGPTSLVLSVNRASFLDPRRSGRDVVQSPPSSANFRCQWVIPLAPLYAFMAFIRTITNMESRTVLMQLSVLVHGFLKLFVFKAANFNNRMLTFSQLQKSC